MRDYNNNNRLKWGLEKQFTAQIRAKILMTNHKQPAYLQGNYKWNNAGKVLELLYTLLS